MESERNLMTTTEAARYLGLKPSYLYKMMMKRVRVKSQEEIDSEAARYLAAHEKNK